MLILQPSVLTSYSLYIISYKILSPILFFLGKKLPVQPRHLLSYMFMAELF